MATILNTEGSIILEKQLSKEDWARFVTVDPLAEKYYSWSPYAYVMNNPIKFVDPTGMYVSIIVNLDNNTITIIDMDQYDDNRETIYVNAHAYQKDGIRDKDGNIAYNQALVIENVFSGGTSSNGVITRDENDPRQDALSSGVYDLTDNKDSEARKQEWFRIDPRDNKRFNDRDDETGRDGFRLHPGSVSFGCVTVDTSKDSEARKQEWSTMSSIIKNTSSSTVKDNRGKRGTYAPSFLQKTLTLYGTVHVK